MFAAAGAARAQFQRGLDRAFADRAGHIHAIERQAVAGDGGGLGERQMQGFAGQRLIAQAALAGTGRHARRVHMPHRQGKNLPRLGALAQRRRRQRQLRGMVEPAGPGHRVAVRVERDVDAAILHQHIVADRVFAGQQRQADAEAAIARRDALDHVRDGPVDAQLQRAGQPHIRREALHRRQVLAVAAGTHAMQCDAVAERATAVDAVQRPALAIERDLLRTQHETQTGAVCRPEAIAQADPVHATIEPQQQLIAHPHERRIGAAIHADVEQLQCIVGLRQRHGHRGADVRLQRDGQRIAAHLQLRLRHSGAGRRALRRLGEAAAQLVQQFRRRQALCLCACRPQQHRQQGRTGHAGATTPVAPAATQRQQQHRHQLRQQDRQQADHQYPQQPHQPSRHHHQPGALGRRHRAGPAKLVVVALVPVRHAGAGLDHAAAVRRMTHLYSHGARPTRHRITCKRPGRAIAATSN